MFSLCFNRLLLFSTPQNFRFYRLVNENLFKNFDQNFN